ncbi:MFS transporter [Chitinimonas prasina]|nr:MFS transporter [Chitinimonas prasina]
MERTAKHQVGSAQQALQPGKRTLVVLALAAVVMGLGQTTLFTFLPLLMHHTGLDLAHITLAFAVGSGLFLLGSPLWAMLSDKLGRRSVVAIALLGFGLSHAMLLWQMQQGEHWAGQADTLLAGRILYGLTVSGLIPTCQAWLADLSAAEHRLAALSRLSAGLTLGRLLGPALAAASLWLNPLGPLWLVALAAWPALLLLPMARPPSGKASTTVSNALNWRPVLAWLGFAWAMQMALGQVQYTLGPWLTQRFVLDAAAASAQLGWMLTGSAVVVMLLQLWVVPRCKPGRPLLLAGGAALCLAGLLLALANHLAMAWLGLAVMGMAAALLVPTYTTLASLAAGQAGQSRVAGAIAATHTVGFSLAAGLAGALFGLWSTAPFLLASLLGGAMVLGGLLISPPRLTPG